MADAVIGNVQEKAMKQYGATQVEVILYSYSIGTIYLLGGQILSGNFVPAARKMFAISCVVIMHIVVANQFSSSWINFLKCSNFDFKLKKVLQ